MSNIHGFGQMNDRNRNPHNSNNQLRNNSGNFAMNQQPNTITLDNLRNAQLHKVLFLSGHPRVKIPREQNYFDMLSGICCPTYKLISFTTLVMIVNLIMFIIQLALGLKKQGSFLQVQAQTLIDLGGNYSPLILQGEVYRLIAPIFLHVSFLHFFGNMMAIMMFLTRIQYTYGSIQTCIIYLISGIGGNIFSATVNFSTTQVKAGASTSLYGIIGVILGYMLINWRGLDILGPILKCQLICQTMMIIVFIFFFSVIGSANVDAMGHLGGFLSGLWLSAIHKTIINETYQKVIRIIFIGLLIIQFILCFVLFYTLN